MLLRRRSLLLLLLWLAAAHSATLAMLYRDKSPEDADPSVEVPADAAPDAPAADALAGRMEAEQRQQQQQAESEETQDDAGAREPQPDTREDQEPQPDTAGAQEPQPDTAGAQEPQPDTAGAQEPQPDTAGAQEPQPDTRKDQEPQPDTREDQEPQPDTREDQEPQLDTREDKEPLPNTTEDQEPQPDTAEDQEPQPDTLIADHEVAAQLTESESPKVQDPEDQSSPLTTEMTADPSDDPHAPAPAARVRRASAQETLSEEEWNEGPANAELQMGKAEEESGWGLSGLRSGFQTVNGFFDSMVELVGGRNGVCQYRCRYGGDPLPRPDYQLPEPNGCASSLLGLQFDMGIPAVTKCCDQLDLCYETCGSNKYRCDSKFHWCLKSLCADLKNSLGFVSKVQACESGADALYNTVWTLGCRPYMNSQRAACVCAGEEREEL